MRLLHTITTILKYCMAAAVALTCAWTLVWVALWIAMIWAVLGFLSGLISGSSVGMSFGGASPTSFGLLNAPVVAVVAFVAAFLHYYLAITAWHSFRTSVTSGAFIAVVLTACVGLGESWLMRIRGYRPLTDREIGYLGPVVEDVRAAMGIRKLPRFGMADNVIPGTLSSARHVILTTGAVGLDRRQLSAMVAHELAHYHSHDGAARRLLWMFALPISVLITVRRVLTVSGGYRMKFFTAMFLWPAIVLERFVVAPTSVPWLRAREYAADAKVADAGYGPGLIHFLNDFKVFETGRSARGSGMNASPLSSELRIQAIERRLMKHNSRVPHADRWGSARSY